MDGARWGTANFSQGKAFASATYGQPSGALSERANLPIMQSALLQSGGRFVFHQGAMPIKEGDVTVGACGVGGATSEQDEEIASVGIAALG
jgi:glc operon protein GlcG